MSDSHDYDLIDRLAEEFAERFRQGERPSVQEYCNKYPHIAADLREMLPALAEVEQVKDEVGAPPAVETPKFREIGDYHILREVGRGGMGVVYEADDTRLGRRVALKVLATGKAGHALERFKREARAAARLHHTNIVPVFGVGDHEGLPYYVMQFIQGLGLDEVLDEVKRLQSKSGSAVMPSAVRSRPRKDISAVAVARSLVTGTFEPPSNGQLAETRTHAPAAVGQVSNLSDQSGQVGNLSYGSPSSSISLPGQSTLTGRKPTYWQSVAQIGLQVADALDYAHKQGILHRDIKPSNLLLDLHGVVWVTDFGLAKAADQEDLTHTGDVFGTLRYMPPEAFEGKSEARSDVYSLGLTMYELLALRPAYDERKKEQLVKQVTTTDPPRLGTLNRAIPRDLRTIVHKAIEKDPSHRYKSAADLAADLRRFLADQTILARRVSPTERFARWCKRNPTVAGLTAAVFVLLVAVATVSAAMAIRIEGKAEEARFEANRANQETDRANAALDDAALNLELAQVVLADQFVQRGAGLLADGDPSGAALCYAKALTIDPVDPERVASHRLRLAAALRDAPRPRHVLFHQARVSNTSVSPDGKLLAVGCDDGTVTFWDLATGTRVGEPIKHDSAIYQVEFTPDGKRLWIVVQMPTAPRPVDDGGFEVREPEPRFRLTLWDRTTGRVTDGPTLNYFKYTPGVAGRNAWFGFTPTARQLQLVDANTGQPVGPEIKTDKPIQYWTASGRSGRVLVVTQEAVQPIERMRDIIYRVGLWDARAGKEVVRPVRVQSVTNAAFCGADDDRVVVLESDGTLNTALQWYDAATGAELARFAPGGTIESGLTVSPDGRRVVVAINETFPLRTRGNSVQVLDADTARQVGPAFVADQGSPFTELVATNRDATRLIVSDGSRGSPRRLVRGDGAVIANQPDIVSSNSAQFSPDGGYLWTIGNDNTARVWDAWTGLPVTPRLPHDGPIRMSEFTPDGSHVVATTGQAVWVWPLVRVEPTRSLAADPRFQPAHLSDDGRRVLEVTLGPGGFGAFQGWARLVDAATGEVVYGPVSVTAGGGQTARALASHVSPDGETVLFTISPVRGGFGFPPKDPANDPPTDLRTRVVLWSGPTGRLTELVAVNLPPFGGGIFANFSPDGRQARVEQAEPDGSLRVRLFDTGTGDPAGPGVTMKRSTAAMGGFGSRNSAQCEWSPDSTVVVVRDPQEAGLRLHLFDPRTGAALGPPIVLAGARGAGVRFDARGDRLLTVVGNPLNASVGRAIGPNPGPGEVRLWDARTGKPLMAPLSGARLGGDFTSAELSPAGDRIAVVVAPGQATGTSGLAVHLWDPTADRPAGPPLTHEQSVRQAAFSPAGDWLLTVTDPRQVRLWSTATGELLHAVPTIEPVVRAYFSADGRRLVAETSLQARELGGSNRFSFDHLQAWDVRTGQPLTPALRALESRVDGGGPFGTRLTPEVVSRNADRFLVSREDGAPTVFALTADDRPADDLVALAELLSARQVNPAGIVRGLGAVGFQDAWDARRARFAADWAAAPVEGLDWHRRVELTGSRLPVAAANRLNPERAGQFLWHLDRLVMAEPGEANFWALRGQAHAIRGEFAAAAADYDRALALKVTPVGLIYRGRAFARAELGKWKEAEEDLLEWGAHPVGGALPFQGPAEGNAVRVPLALVRLRRGDEKGYRDTCKQLAAAARGAKVGNGVTAVGYNVYWPVLLRDGVDDQQGEVLPTAADLPRLRGAGGPLGRSFKLGLGLRYRQGRYKEAEAEFNPSGATACDYFFLAMAQHKQGNPEAAKSLAKGVELQGQPRATSTNELAGRSGAFVGGWQVRVAEDELRKEAEGLILGKK